MKKRILALFLAGVMTFTMAPAEAFATAPGGESSASPETEETVPEKEDAADTEEDISFQKDSIDVTDEMFSDTSEPVELPERMIPEETESETESELPEGWTPPVGGMVRPEVIELPEGATDSLDTLD